MTYLSRIIFRSLAEYFIQKVTIQDYVIWRKCGTTWFILQVATRILHFLLIQKIIGRREQETLKVVVEMSNEIKMVGIQPNAETFTIQ